MTQQSREVRCAAAFAPCGFISVGNMNNYQCLLADQACLCYILHKVCLTLQTSDYKCWKWQSGFFFFSTYADKIRTYI